MKFLSTRKGNLDVFLSLVSQYLSESSSARIDAFNAWLKRKGVALEAQKRFQEVLIYSDDPEAVTSFKDLSRVRAQLSKLVFAGPGEEDRETYNKKMAELEVEKERLEAKLSRLSQAFALKQKIGKADCKKLAKALPEGTALLEFARVDIFNFKTF